VLLQELKLACIGFSPLWDDFKDALMLVQKGKLARTSFSPWWNDNV